MYERWDIPNNICSTDPITRSTLKIFTGRTNDIKTISKFLNRKAIIVLEGEIGVGKTSLGNFCRFSNNDRYSPELEIRCFNKWSSVDFAHEVMARIYDDIKRTTNKFQSIRDTTIYKKLEDRYEDKENMGFNAGIGVVNGGISKSTTRTNYNSQSVIENDLEELGKAFANFSEQEAPIIIQLNNMDINHTFSETELSNFLNSIRDILQIKYYSWIINGAPGLLGLIRSNVNRLADVISKDSFVSPLTYEETKAAFSQRIKTSGMNGKLPLEEDLLNILYIVSNGKFRRLLNTVNQLLMEFYDQPLIKTITIESAVRFFAKEKQSTFEQLKSKKVNVQILKYLAKKPGCIQKDITNELKKQQGNLSKSLTELERIGFIHSSKNGVSVNYFPEPEIYLATRGGVFEALNL